MWVRMQGEADLAAALFFKLRSMLLDAHHAKKEGVKATKVGVITPYRQQRKCLQDTFLALCAENAKEVSIKAANIPTSLLLLQSLTCIHRLS